MVKSQDLVLNSPADKLSMCMWFISKHFTYLLQAVLQKQARD